MGEATWVADGQQPSRRALTMPSSSVWDARHRYSGSCRTAACSSHARVACLMKALADVSLATARVTGAALPLFCNHTSHVAGPCSQQQPGALTFNILFKYVEVGLSSERFCWCRTAIFPSGTDLLAGEGLRAHHGVQMRSRRKQKCSGLMLHVQSNVERPSS